MKRFVYIFLLLLSGNVVWAQEQPAAASAAPVQAGNIHMDILIGVFILSALLLLLVAVVMLRSVRIISKQLANNEPCTVHASVPMMEYEEWAALQKTKPGIWTKILSLKPLSEEKDMVLDHEFDGIAELDNPTPPWFMWLFYSTIAFAFVYLIYYHVLDYGKMQEEEYVIEMKAATAERNAYLAKSANNIDENSVKESTDGNIISAGQAIFNTNCVACHGDKGQGTVGPNLTDVYWLHGGKINNIFKTIKYGVPEKGMVSWEKTLTPKQISDVSNYILSLKGSNPANGKAPQGEQEG